MDDVVGKPFRVAELLVRMKSILEKVADSNSGPEVGVCQGG